MQDYLKFLKKLPKNLRSKLIQAVERIFADKTDRLDVKHLNKYHNLYRCRVGKIRIIFQKREDGNHVLDIGFRDDIYKKLRNY